MLIFTALYCTLYGYTQDSRSSKFKVAVSGGYAYRLGKKAGNDQYFKEISKGPVFASDATYFLSSKHGIGLNYALFSSSGSLYPTIISNIKITYVGASYNFRLTAADQKMAFQSGVGLGYMGYKDNGWINSVPTTITSATLGTRLNAGADFRIIKGLSAGIQVSLYGGTLSRVRQNGTVKDLKMGEMESLTRIEGVAGLRYDF